MQETLARQDAGTVEGRTPMVSVVIPTMRRAKNLGRCLLALSRQTLLQEYAIEIVVVARKLDEDTVLVCSSFKDPGPMVVKLLAFDEPGPGPARNLGVMAATADLIAFTDDDCEPDPKWLDTLVRTWTHTKAKIVGGKTLTASKVRTNQYSHAHQEYIKFCYREFNADLTLRCGTTTNLLIEKDVFHLLGGFDEHMVECCGEDRDFNWKWCEFYKNEPYSLEYNEQALVYHAHDFSAWELIKTNFRYGRGDWQCVATQRLRGDKNTLESELFLPLPATQRMIASVKNSHGPKIAFWLAMTQVVRYLGVKYERYWKRTIR